MNWKIGDTAEMTTIVDDQRIRNFAIAVEDMNPIHLDDAAADKSIYGRRVAHGMIAASFITAVMGSRCPGAGSVLLGQTLKYTAPVYVNDTITAKVTITQIQDVNPILTLATSAANQHGRVVIEGEATVLLREVPY